MNPEDTLLDVRDLRVSFFTGNSEVKAVGGVSYHVGKGEIIAMVGESGCGKSVTQMSTLQLIQPPRGKIIGGQILFEGKDLLQYSADSKEMQAIRGAQISMIFQEPMTSLNPVFTVGAQISEVIRLHSHMSKDEAWRIGTEALSAVGIPEAASRMNSYPFEMSGGMRQRVLIAIAVACKSKLIIADEPTTALDVTTQAQVMELLLDVVHKYGTSLIIVTHNLGLVARYAQRIYVMYAGRVIETGTTREILKNPAHPYTKGLMASVPRLDSDRHQALIPIEGMPPRLDHLKDECAFLPRCSHACALCRSNSYPPLVTMGPSHQAACYLCREGVSQ
jgi:peptide/nickel transport system ATP-binding protein